MSLSGLMKHLRERLRDRAFVIISAVFIAFCLFSTVWWSINFRASYLAMSALFILLVPLIAVVEYFVGMRCGAVFVACVLGIAAGSILGTPFDFYTALPHLDTFLHGLSGFVFACLGFTLVTRFFGEPRGARRFAGTVIFAVCFSLAIAVVWEIHEYMCTVFLDMEMMDDTYVFDIKSFVLGGSRAEPVIIDGITKTVIYYGNGESFVMDGYLDLGLIDTLADMIICTVGAVIFAIISVIGHNKAPWLCRAIVPSVVSDIGGESEERCGSDAA